MDTENIPIKYCLYARKSSESDERQAMSIDSQIKEMLDIAERDKLNVTEIREESKSAKATGARQEFNKLLKDIDEGKFNAILTWAPDRLSRNAGDLGSLVDRMDGGKLLQIRTHGQNFTNTPNEKFLLMILCSQAKLENDNRGKNVKRGLRAKCERGKRPGMPPLGYKLYRDPEDYSKGSTILLDPERAPFIKKMFNYVTEHGFSGRQTNDFLTGEGFRTRSGKNLSLSMTYRIYKDTFYFGEFEYPVGSGVVYQGVHEPIITKEQWEKANSMLKTFEKKKWGSNNFYFSRLFKCGACQSGVCGETHTNRHGKEYIYYKCTKYGGNKRCDEKYIREDKLVESIASLIDQFKNKDLQIHKKVTREVEKFNEMQRMTIGENAKQISPTEYIGYILKNGTSLEKRQFLKCLEGQLWLRSGEVGLNS
ncbi:recombinase family protein [Candidatus Peregrinibacteria bacterium]|jgi:site-specific DNA recombinase|nr:recombinase family protein [Candidatus Peregrinibacteria bacterium]MBT7703122.1 recombinase family protein [Candidatus Peregrinibacteria bacterium]